MQEEVRHVRQSLQLLWLVLLWLVVMLFMIALEVLQSLPRPAIPAAILGPVVLGVWSWRRSTSLRAWSARVDLRVLALPHLLRMAFGSAFLWHVTQGTLPMLFGKPAGLGDLIAGLGALLLIASGTKSRWMWLGWNVLGLCDMVMVIGLAQYHIFGGHFDQMTLMFAFPYALAPLITVPILLMTHLIMLYRTVRT